MTILPKLMYIFEAVPFFIPRGELRTMQMTILYFIWAERWHRITKSVLLTPKFRGGLAVPDILKYFWAAQLWRVPAWSSLFSYTIWMEIKKLWIAPIFMVHLRYTAADQKGVVWRIWTITRF